MPGDYSLKNFNDDIRQLGGMIENFYSQNGSKKRGGGQIHSFRQSGGEENNLNKNKEKENKVVRYFKVLSVNGKPYPKYARYKGAEPKDAAKKAGKWICKALDMNNKNCKLEFQLKETTRGSDHRSYGPYKGHWEKLSKPKTFKFKGMTKPETVTHKFVVKLHKK